MLDLQQFKKGKAINIIESFQNYCENNSKNYIAFKDDIEALNKYRNLIIKQDPQLNEENLYQNINDNLTYIQILTKINQSILIGEEKEQWDIKFSWTNITKLNPDSFSNFFYEICSVKYNIGINFCLLGYLNLNSKEESKLKNSKQNFEKAAFVFDEIKELSKNIIQYQISDFSEEYLDICKNVSLGFAQYYIYLFAFVKKLSLSSISKHIGGAYHFFSTALSFKFQSETCNKQLIYYLEHYFNSLSIHYFVLSKIDVVNKNKKGLGLLYGYESYAYELLKEIKNDLNSIQKYFDINLINNLLSKVTDFLQENYNKVKNVEKVVDKQSLPKLEYSQLAKLSNYMESPEQNTNKILNLNKAMESLSLNKIPSDLVNLVTEYKDKLENNLKNKFEEYENSDKILKFLSEKDLPYILEPFLEYNPGTTPNGEITIDNRISGVIQFIKGKGGINYLKKYMNELDKNYNMLMNILNKYDNIITNYIQEDNNYKQLFGNQYQIQSPINFQIELNNLRNILRNAKIADDNIKTTILSKEKHYLVFDRNEQDIIDRIPNPVVLITDLNSAKNLKESLNVLNNDETLINKAFNFLLEKVTNNIPFDELKSVQNNQTTIENIIEDELKKLKPSFNYIEGYSNKIKKDMQDVETKFNIFDKESSKIKNESYNKTIVYFTKVKSLFVSSEEQLNQRMNFYNDFKNRGIRNFQESFNGYCFMRDIVVRELKDNNQN